MDPNFGHAGLVRYFATSYLRDLQSQPEVVVHPRENHQLHTSRATGAREWVASRLIAWGTRLGHAAVQRQADAITPF